MQNYNDVIAKLNSGQSFANDEIEELLNSNNEYLIWAGIKIIGQQKVEGKTKLLLSSVTNITPNLNKGIDADQLTSITAWALSQLTPSYIEKFVSENENSLDEITQTVIADLLGLVSLDSEIEILKKLIISDFQNTSKWAALSLSKKGNVSVNVLESALFTSKNDWYKAYSIDALKNISTPESKQILNKFLNIAGNDKFKAFL